MDNFMAFSDQQVKLVTQSHLIWAEIGSHLKDYEGRVQKIIELTFGTSKPTIPEHPENPFT